MKIIMKKIMIAVLSVFTLMQTMTPAALADQAKKVLMIISGYGKDNGKTRPGYEFDEFASAYLVFKTNGVAVDIASPNGGLVEADQYNPKTPTNALVLADKAAIQQLENSMPLSMINSSDYDAVFVVGGKGAMFDFHDNVKLQNIISDIYVRGGTVSAVCHGPAALVNVKLPNGKYLIDGKKVNGFTNIEEKTFGSKWMPDFEFMLEDKLISRGGKYQSSPMMLSHVATDGRLITGQNPSSTPNVAEEVVKSLGITPVVREKGKDEVTFELIADYLNGSSDALEQYTASPEMYNGRLLVTYGYFFSNAANTAAEHMQAIKLMQMEPKLSGRKQVRLQTAKSWHKSGNRDKAVETLEIILADDPDFEPAKKLMAKVTQ